MACAPTRELEDLSDASTDMVIDTTDMRMTENSPPAFCEIVLSNYNIEVNGHRTTSDGRPCTVKDIVTDDTLIIDGYILEVNQPNPQTFQLSCERNVFGALKLPAPEFAKKLTFMATFFKGMVRGVPCSVTYRDLYFYTAQPSVCAIVVNPSFKCP